MTTDQTIVCRVTVLESDVLHGLRKKSCYCPVAHAVARAAGVSWASVSPAGEGRWSASVHRDHVRYRGLLPLAAGEAAQRYDDTGEFSLPLSFALTLTAAPAAPAAA